jgi:hypothetical protein
MLKDTTTSRTMVTRVVTADPNTVTKMRPSWPSTTKASQRKK